MGFGSTFGGPRYVNIAVEQVKELEEIHGLSIETIITEGTGGGVADITFNVDPGFNDPFILNGDEGTLTLRLTNTSSVATSVELTFSGNILKANTFDSGTESNPYYLIDPNSTKDVTLSRGSAAPSGSDPAVDCTITYTLADGTVSERTDYITVEAPLIFTEVVRTIGGISSNEVYFEAQFDSLANTGTVSGDYIAANMTINPNTTEEPPFVGFAEPANTSARVYHSGPSEMWSQADIEASKFCKTSGHPLTWIYVWTNTATTDGILVRQGNQWGPGQLNHNGGPLYASQSNIAFSFDTNKSHTQLASSEAMDRTTNRLCMLAATWDGTNTMTYRWKQDGHEPGFSYGTASNVTVDSNNPTDMYGSFNLVGYDMWTVNSATRFRYAAIVKGEIDDSIFGILLGLVGL